MTRPWRPGSEEATVRAILDPRYVEADCWSAFAAIMVHASEFFAGYSGNGGPALNALATIMLVMSFAVATIGFVAYRWMTRGERGANRQEANSPGSSMLPRREPRDRRCRWPPDSHPGPEYRRLRHPNRGMERRARPRRLPFRPHRSRRYPVDLRGRANTRA